MNEKEFQHSANWKNIFILQVIIIIYTLAGVAGKFASRYTFLSSGFVLSYCIEIVILGVYAVFWQQILKRFDISVAYANRSIAIVWSMIWSVIIFHESISVQNLIGIVLIIFGTIIVNGDNNE